MALYDPVDGVYRKVAKKYDPVNGVYRKVKAAYDPVDGVYRKYFGGGTPVGSLAVGESVWLNVGGALTEFLVVHQGNPDSKLYDASCDGTWLMMKDIYENRRFDDDSVDYPSSEIHAYLNGTFLGKFDSNTQSVIKQVKIPHVYDNGECWDDQVEEYVHDVWVAYDLSAQIFLLSFVEVNGASQDAYHYPDGACLDYFSGTSSQNEPKRKAYYNETACWWFTRSADRRDENYTAIECVNSSGSLGASGGCMYAKGIRPAFILDSNTPIAQADGKNIIE